MWLAENVPRRGAHGRKVARWPAAGWTCGMWRVASWLAGNVGGAVQALAGNVASTAADLPARRPGTRRGVQRAAWNVARYLAGRRVGGRVCRPECVAASSDRSGAHAPLPQAATHALRKKSQRAQEGRASRLTRHCAARPCVQGNAQASSQRPSDKRGYRRGGSDSSCWEVAKCASRAAYL